MALVDTLLPEFDHEMTVTRKFLERVPDGRFDWKPHPKSYTLGALAQHVATVPMWGLITLKEEGLDAATVQPLAPRHTRADVLDLFDAHVASTRAALVSMSDAEFKAPWTLKREGHTIFSSPKHAVWRSFVMSHLVHHRAQLGVYLRMQDVAVPSAYGPSADEGGF